MGSAVGDFTVTVAARQVVVAPLPLQEHWLPLSNLDLVLPRTALDVGVFFCYTSNPKMSFREKASALKKALAEALVCFYAFAGEVVENSDGEPEIHCNNRGVELLEASALDVELRELNLYEPDGCVDGKLVPKKKRGILCVQITELKCGGTVVGCTFDHRVADAYSANMFLVAWARIATSSTVATIKPSFRRSLLNPRHPLSYSSALIDDVFVTYSTMPSPPPPAADQPAMISRIYHLPAAQLSALQSLATTSTHKTPSKLQTMSSYLWKLIGEHAFQLQNHAVSSAESTCNLGIVVDGRQRLGATMGSYFGNVVSVPYDCLAVKELVQMPLANVAEAVGRFLAPATTKEHFLGLVDWVEAQRPKPIVARVCTEGTDVEPAFVVSSGQRFPVSEVDFGWGQPVFGSYHFPWGGSAGYVMPMPSPNGNGDWIVYLLMLETQLNFTEDNASSVFRPFTLDMVQA